MPSDQAASEIRGSLAQGERYEDFAYLFDALVGFRRPYTQNARLSEKVVGKLLCVVFPDKPPKYIRAMIWFRLHFVDVSEQRALQAEFSNCVKMAAITLEQPEDVVWRPSLYFSLPRRWRSPAWF